MTDRSKAAQIERLHVSIALADRLAVLLSDEVQAIFDDEKNKLTAKMIDAAPDDDDTRRSAALELRALQQFRARLQSIATAGRQSSTTLEKIANG